MQAMLLLTAYANFKFCNFSERFSEENFIIMRFLTNKTQTNCGSRSIPHSWALEYAGAKNENIKA
jgi:hypothetical protein